LAIYGERFGEFLSFHHMLEKKTKQHENDLAVINFVYLSS